MAQDVARRRWALLVVVCVVLAGAAGAGLVLRQFRPISGTVNVTDATAVGSVGAKAPPRPPEPGPAAVVLTEDSAVHPDANQIRKVVQRYFDAINAGDYKLWRGAVIPQWARDVGEAAWRNQYRSTLDGSIVVQRVEPRMGGGLIALVSYTSVQNPADAPPALHVRCLRWWVSYPLFGTGDQIRLGPSSPNSDLRTAC
ncbi:MAG: hypothetical protein ACRDSH_16290 [Pseudonocardiaceae bacterium]